MAALQQRPSITATPPPFLEPWQRHVSRTSCLGDVTVRLGRVGLGWRGWRGAWCLGRPCWWIRSIRSLCWGWWQCLRWAGWWPPFTQYIMPPCWLYAAILGQMESLGKAYMVEQVWELSLRCTAPTADQGLTTRYWLTRGCSHLLTNPPPTHWHLLTHHPPTDTC